MWPKALLLGDSQTQLAGAEGGWAQLLADKFVRRLDFINRGFSGQRYQEIMQIKLLYINKLQDIIRGCCLPFSQIFSTRNIFKYNKAPTYYVINNVDRRTLERQIQWSYFSAPMMPAWPALTLSRLFLWRSSETIFSGSFPSC